MNSREIIQRTIHFQNPPRVGMYFGRFGDNDTVNVFEFFIKDEHGVDPWGITWEVHPDIPSIGMPKEHPLANSEDFSRIKTPDPKEFAQMTMRNLENLTPADREKYRFIATSSGIWERIQYFRGMEQLFEDLYDNPQLVHDMIAFCTDFWVAYLHELAPAQDELDAIYQFDDWGTQMGAMIRPSVWREFFAEPYKRITDAAHANGMDYWLHSCGKVTELIGDFIDVGMDLISPYQSGTCGYEEVAEKYAGKIAFMTSVDSQSTLTHGTPAEVYAECKRLEKWGTPHGGLIIGDYPYDTPEENERTVYDYFTALKLA